MGAVANQWFLPVDKWRGVQGLGRGVRETAPQDWVISLRTINMEVLFYKLQFTALLSRAYVVEGESEP